MALDLTQEESQLLTACDRNFRRNLRNAADNNLTIAQWFNPDLDEVLSIYASMQNVKGIDEQLSREEIEQMMKHLGQDLVIYRCEDPQGKAISLLGTFVMGDKAASLLWATSEEGRKQLASYPSFWDLMLHCRRLGVTVYDLAGIDPVRNHGVYRFKRATGATPVEYLGEWNWASRPWLLWFGNFAIAERDALKRFEPIARILLAPLKVVKALRLKAGKGPVRAAATLATDHRTSPL
jgi:lipid II:glycine glycyltransferase (peptidoglycan interpeptide bridge formation enzyme)